MGLIRVWLAIVVVFDHNGIRTFGFDGYLAVLFFFIISGFFMALVLNEKYETGAFNFYLARYLKLWPSYIVVLLLIVIFLRPIGNVGPYSLVALMYTYFVSATMFFYETLWWIGFDKGNGSAVLFPIPGAGATVITLAWFTSMAHMWSIGIELMFYLVAPFLARSPTRILIAFVVSYLVHIFIALNFEPTDPFRFRNGMNFFWLFLMGMLSYWFWRKRCDVFSGWASIALAIPFAGLVSTFIFIVLAQLGATVSPSALLSDVFFAAFACLVGPVFHLTKYNRLDAKLAVLSYPIYLAHWPIVYILIRGHRGEVLWSIYIAAFSIAGAIALHQLVDKPVERYRKRLVRKAVPIEIAAVSQDGFLEAATVTERASQH